MFDTVALRDATIQLLAAAREWPHDPPDFYSGSRRSEVSYTMAQARRLARAIEAVIKALRDGNDRCYVRVDGNSEAVCVRGLGHSKRHRTVT
jgi:hypothetical protein